MIVRRTVEQSPPLATKPVEPGINGGVPSIDTLETKVQWVVHRGAPEYDFKDMFEGDILHRRLDRQPEMAGRFLAIRFRTDDAHDAGITIPKVMGECRPWSMPYYRVLFDEGTDELKKSVRMRFGVHGSNVLLVHSVLVLPDHRGHDLGLAVTSRLIETLGDGCSLIACRLLAAQLCPPLPDRKFHDAMRLDEFIQDRRLAIRRVWAHVRKLGFRRVGHSDVFAAAHDPGFF